MLRVASWIALLLGLLILAFIALHLIELARVMAAFGGIPWSMDLLRLNIGLVAVAAFGIALVILAGCGFAWVRRRSH